MKRLQEETMCKMAVLGRGSMKDRAKEEELRNSLDPKYAHLSDDLHVEISALGTHPNPHPPNPPTNHLFFQDHLQKHMLVLHLL